MSYYKKTLLSVAFCATLGLLSADAMKSNELKAPQKNEKTITDIPGNKLDVTRSLFSDDAEKKIEKDENQKNFGNEGENKKELLRKSLLEKLNELSSGLPEHLRKIKADDNDDETSSDEDNSSIKNEEGFENEKEQLRKSLLKKLNELSSDLPYYLRNIKADDNDDETSSDEDNSSIKNEEGFENGNSINEANDNNEKKTLNLSRPLLSSGNDCFANKESSEKKNSINKAGDNHETILSYIPSGGREFRFTSEENSDEEENTNEEDGNKTPKNNKIKNMLVTPKIFNNENTLKNKNNKIENTGEVVSNDDFLKNEKLLNDLIKNKKTPKNETTPKNKKTPKNEKTQKGQLSPVQFLKQMSPAKFLNMDEKDNNEAEQTIIAIASEKPASNEHTSIAYECVNVMLTQIDNMMEQVARKKGFWRIWKLLRDHFFGKRKK